MNADNLRFAAENVGVAAVGIAFLAGLAFSFNPVALVSIPVSLAYVTRGRDKGQAHSLNAVYLRRDSYTCRSWARCEIRGQMDRIGHGKSLETISRAAFDRARSDPGAGFELRCPLSDFGQAARFSAGAHSLF